MLEKPAGVRLDEYKGLIDLAQRKHLHLQMIYLFRYMSAVQELLKRVRSGELGRIYEFRPGCPKTCRLTTGSSKSWSDTKAASSLKWPGT